VDQRYVEKLGVVFEDIIETDNEAIRWRGVGWIHVVRIGAGRAFLLKVGVFSVSELLLLF
jgi:hypothetical protein